MLFNHKLDLKLIHLVRENPVLYDHNNANYMDCNAREVAWHKIGDELQYQAADCKVRWINIRDVYRRIQKKKLSGSGPRKKYKYENELTFMKPFFKDVKASISDYESDTKNVEVNDHYDDGPSSDIEDEIPITKLKNKKTAKSSSKKKKTKRYEDEQMSASPSEVSTVTCDFDRSDPVDAFLLSIGATLKTFSPYHLNIAKSKIFSVVQEHDLQQIAEKKRSEESLVKTSQKYSDSSKL